MALLGDLLFDFFQQIVGVFFVDVQLAVAGDAEGSRPEYLIAAKKLAGLQIHNPSQRHKVQFVVLARQAQDARQYARHGCHPHHGLPLSFEQGPDAQGLVEDAGEGVRRIDDNGREDRFEFFLPVLAHEVEVLVFESARLPEVDAFGG